MKKTLKSFALMLLTAFAFSSCVDVPAPYNLPDKSSNSGSGGGTENIVEPAGEGTLNSPYNVAAIVALINEMEAGVESTQEYYVKGKVLAVKTDAATISQYGNHTFTIVDEGTSSPVFTAFQVYGPDKKKFTSVDDIKVGDEVVVCGKVVNYRGNTPETVGKGAAYVVSINSSGDGGQGGDTPVQGTEVTCAKAVELTNALADNKDSDEIYTVTGYITSIASTVSSGKQSFYMNDTKGGEGIFEAFKASLPTGVSEFVVGMKVKITGHLTKYVNNSGKVTPEIKDATVVILEQGGGDTPPVGDAIEATCAQAAEAANALADGGTSTDTYAVTGYITETDGKVSRNQQIIWMADTQDGGKVFEGYWANLPSGVSVLTVGMKVKMTGKLMKYVNNSTGEVTPEIKNGDIVILEQGDGGQGGGGDTPGPGGDEVTELVNGDFEDWVSDSEPTGWKSASTASNATLSKSTDARGGSFACSIGAPGTQNKRLATQEITLEAGTYTFSFYAKATTGDVCQTRPGHATIGDDGTPTYVYPKNGSTNVYFDLNNNEWTYISYEFTLTKTTKLCLLVMNPKGTEGKNVSQDILVDDATLVKK